MAAALRKKPAESDEPVDVADEAAPDNATVGSLGPTDAELEAREQIKKDALEVREQQLAAREAAVTSVPAGKISVAYANQPEEGEPESITFAHVGGVLVVTSSTSEPLRFGREEALGLQRAVANVGAAL